MIVAINFADEKYEPQRKYNTYTAYKKGKVDKVIEYKPSDIDKVFYQKNESILSYKRGAGLWLWKPYFILKTLKNIREGEYLLYSDSGSFFINKINHLVLALEREGVDVMPFELPLLERQYTKMETFAKFGITDFSKNQFLASYILFKKSKRSISFVEEWLEALCDESILSPNKYNTNIIELNDFIAHREDQSIFSILCHKYKFQGFRDPSQFGIRPWEYRGTGRILNIRSYTNSNYPQILISNRNFGIHKYKYKEIIKMFLFRIGCYSEKGYFKFR